MLDAFGPRRHELTLGEIADAAGVTAPSALRIGFTLVQAGYLVRNPVTKGYRLGPRALLLGREAGASMTLREIALPFLLTLRQATHEMIKLAVPSQTEVIVIDFLPSLRYPRAAARVGARMSMLGSSLGRAMLAWQSDENIKTILAAAREVRYTPKTFTKEMVCAELSRTRQRGYAVNDRGTNLTHRSVAAPVLDASGRAVAAINVSTSTYRVTLADLEQRFAHPLVHTAEAISAVIPTPPLGDDESFLTA